MRKKFVAICIMIVSRENVSKVGKFRLLGRNSGYCLTNEAAELSRRGRDIFSLSWGKFCKLNVGERKLYKVSINELWRFSLSSSCCTCTCLLRLIRQEWQLGNFSDRSWRRSERGEVVPGGANPGDGRRGQEGQALGHIKRYTTHTFTRATRRTNLLRAFASKSLRNSDDCHNEARNVKDTECSWRLRRGII